MSVALPLFSHSSQDQNWREKKLIRFWWFDGVIVVVVVECFYIISPLECIRFVPREWKQQIPSKLCKHNFCILLRWLFVTILSSFLPYRKIHIGTGTCLCAHYLFLVNEKHAHTKIAGIFNFKPSCATTTSYSMQIAPSVSIVLHHAQCALFRYVKVQQLICEWCHEDCKHIKTTYSVRRPVK